MTDKVVYTICIGSNEHKEANLRLARRRLEELFPDIRFSMEEETKPLYCQRKALFANQVARFVSDSGVGEIVPRLKAIEREAGRTPEEKAQDIVRLDIDLLTCDGTVYKPEDLKRDYVRRGLRDLENNKR